VIPETRGFEWLRVPGSVAPRIPGFLERVSSGCRSSGWFREPESHGTSLGKPGTPSSVFSESSGDSGSRSPSEICVHGVTRNSVFTETPCSRSHLELRVRNSEFPSDFGNPEIRVTPGSRGGWIREPGYPGKSGNPDFRVTLGTRNFGWTRNLDFRVAPGIPRSGWLRETRVSGVTPNYGFT